MACYTIEWRNSARRELRHLAPPVVSRIVMAVSALGHDPRPSGCRKLVGSEHTYRIRVGAYRVIYEVLDDRLLVEVVRARHRRDAYR